MLFIAFIAKFELPVLIQTFNSLKIAITSAFILVFSNTLTLFYILLLRVLGPDNIAFDDIKEKTDNV